MCRNVFLTFRLHLEKSCEKRILHCYELKFNNLAVKGSLWSEFCRILRIQVGGTHAKKVKTTTMHFCDRVKCNGLVLICCGMGASLFLWLLCSQTKAISTHRQLHWVNECPHKLPPYTHSYKPACATKHILTSFVMLRCQ